ncbi:MAG: FAD-dependent oxidoreductase [Polyangiaceae bacterium]
MPPPSFQTRLVSSTLIAPAVRELVFEKLDGPLKFAPGQWLNMHLPGPKEGTEITRAYSIASCPDGTPRFALAVTKVENGPGSTALHALQPGVEVRATGPQGFFTRDADVGHPSLFVATGTGLTPLRSMIHAALREGATEPLVLLLGVRHGEDRLYADELAELEAKHPGFKAHFTLSRPSPEWKGRTGYVQTHVDELWKGLVDAGRGAPHVYICGLERMVKAVRDKLRKEHTVPRDRVHSERYD